MYALFSSVGFINQWGWRGVLITFFFFIFFFFLGGGGGVGTRDSRLEHQGSETNNNRCAFLTYITVC